MTDQAAAPFLPPTPVSPCIQVCTLDDNQVCIGCGRTVDEIIDWTRMTAVQKWAVLTLSAQRRNERAQRQNFHQEVIDHGPKR